jgi:transcriptional regulator with XRE-family HTH domain
MTNSRDTTTVASFQAVGTARIDAVENAPLTSSDVVRELKKEALDVFGTRAKFSRAMGENDQVVGRYFRGERDMPADFLLRAIAGLGVTPEQFFANARSTRAVPTKGD